MKFFFADSLDLVDPSFDFRAETRSPHRIRQQDDLYPHELFKTPPYDGLLVSKAIVDGTAGGASGKYSMAQRQRLLRQGVRNFFRLGNGPLKTMGDCGAFTYVREEIPPYSVDEVISFYESCREQRAKRTPKGLSERASRHCNNTTTVRPTWRKSLHY
jgi:hypothetical protein